MHGYFDGRTDRKGRGYNPCISIHLLRHKKCEHSYGKTGGFDYCQTALNVPIEKYRKKEKH